MKELTIKMRIPDRIYNDMIKMWKRDYVFDEKGLSEVGVINFDRNKKKNYKKRGTDLIVGVVESMARLEVIRQAFHMKAKPLNLRKTKKH